MRVPLILALALPAMLRAQVSRPAVQSREPTLKVVEAAGNPTGFTATAQHRDVLFSWQPVSGVTAYLLGGPGMGPNGKVVKGTSYTATWVGPGSHEWTVASLGPDQAPLTNWATWSKAQAAIDPALYAITFEPYAMGGRMGGDGMMILFRANHVNLTGKIMSLNPDSGLEILSRDGGPYGTYELRLNLSGISGTDTVNVTLRRAQQGTAWSADQVVGQCALQGAGTQTCQAQIPVTADFFDVYAVFGMARLQAAPIVQSVSLAVLP